MFGRSESVLGVNCEHGRLSMTLASGKEIKKTVCVVVPENIVRGSEIVSANLFAALIKDTMKENGIHAKSAAYAIPVGDVFIRNVTMPRMSADQVKLNIPFEFRDFIQGELKEYVFDYMHLPDLGARIDESTGEVTIHLLAAAIKAEKLNELTTIFKKAGLKLVKAIPEIISYENLLRLLPNEEERNKERCFLDIGQGITRMIIYKDGHYKLTHMIDIGERKVVQTIADEMNVDMHLARTYLGTNYENCQELNAVKSVYKDISLEILKGINFYEVSDFTARLADIAVCGGGAMITPLVELLKERITMNVVTMQELYQSKNVDKFFNLTAPSYGMVLD